MAGNLTWSSIMRSNCESDFQGYGATAIERDGYKAYPVPVSSWRTPSHMQVMYIALGWLAYCGNPAIYTYTDYMVAYVRGGNSQIKQFLTPLL